MARLATTTSSRLAGRRRRLSQNRRLLIGGTMLLAVLIMALLADVLAPYPPYELSTGPRTSPPSVDHLAGTDLYGRDQLSRLIVGARISIQAGLVVALGALAVGFPLGLAAGYQGGWTDEAIGRLLDVVVSFPWLLMALGIAAVFGPSLNTAFASLIIAYVPIIARLTRAVALSERHREYVAAARVGGSTEWRIVRRHLVPNVISPIIVLTTSIMAYAVLAEASLSYLGLGAQPPTASWGRMLTENGQFFVTAPYLALFPGLAISWLVFSLNLVGEGMRDYLDPRQAKLAK